MLLYIFSELPVSGSQANPSACSSGLVQRYLAPTCTCMNPRAEAQVDKNRVLKKKKKRRFLGLLQMTQSREEKAENRNVIGQRSLAETV